MNNGVQYYTSSSNDFMQLLVISSPKFHAKYGKTKKHRGGTLNITEIW